MITEWHPRRIEWLLMTPGIGDYTPQDNCYWYLILHDIHLAVPVPLSNVRHSHPIFHHSSQVDSSQTGVNLLSNGPTYHSLNLKTCSSGSAQLPTSTVIYKPKWFCSKAYFHFVQSCNIKTHPTQGCGIGSSENTPSTGMWKLTPHKNTPSTGMWKYTNHHSLTPVDVMEKVANKPPSLLSKRK